MSKLQTAINNVCHHGVSGLTNLWINLYEYYEREGVEEIHFDLCSVDDSYDEPMQISIAKFRDKAIEIILTTSGHGLAYFKSFLITLSIIERYPVSQVWAGFTSTYKMRIVAQYQGHEYAVEKETVSYK
ncbi:MAG: hypothetical protein JST84_23095 [Acidobacteria bacterium]|nr:hypothetical protein [Acidobacteriota bacterium]